MIVLAPDGVAVMVLVVVVRAVKGVVHAHNDKQEPGEDGEDLVGQKIAARELFAFCEWIV